ncbi:hypothetical protein JCM8547_003183 [Rhodosporidiobolus lusitaniae]
MSSASLSAPAAASLRDSLVALDSLIEIEEDAVAKRAAKRTAAKPSPTEKALIRACSECRRSKSKCEMREGKDEVCPRCEQLKLACVVPASRTRGPKKRLSKTHRLLLDAKRGIEAALSGTAVADPLDEDTEDEQQNEEDVPMREEKTGSSDDLDDSTLLGNPLAVLAQQAAIQQAEKTSQAGPTRRRRLELDLSRPEHDLTLEPVYRKFLSQADLNRLVKLYFDRLYPFLWLLLPDLHTPSFLQSHSPFLTTGIAWVAATYDPLASHLVLPLEQHARQLAAQILDEGLRSVEIVQAFFILSHWTPPDSDSSQSRAWQYFSHAWSIATELRLSHSVEVPESLHERNRNLTASLLFCGELAMYIQSGRTDYLRAPPPPPIVFYPLSDYNYVANLQLNSFIASSLHLASGLSEERGGENLRSSFVSFWKPKLQAWRAKWPDINPFIDIHAENQVTILNLTSLRFKGEPSTTSLLSDCKASALRAIQKVSSWEDSDTQLAYCSNYVIVNVSYSTVLLLQLAGRFKHGLTADLRAKALRVAAILERVGRDRPNSSSLATMHAHRIRHLVDSLTAASSSAPSPLPEAIPSFSPGSSTPALHPPVFPPLPTASPTSSWPEFGLPLSTPAADFLDWSMQDPMLNWFYQTGAEGGDGALEFSIGAGSGS